MQEEIWSLEFKMKNNKNLNSIKIVLMSIKKVR